MSCRRRCHYRFREEETLSGEVLTSTSLTWEQKTASSLRSLVCLWRQRVMLHKWDVCSGCRSSPDTQPLLPAAGWHLCERKLRQEEAGRGRLLLTIFKTRQSKGLVQPNAPTLPTALKAQWPWPLSHMLRSPQCVPCSAMLLLLISVLDVIFAPSKYHFFLSFPPNTKVTVF